MDNIGNFAVGLLILAIVAFMATTSFGLIISRMIALPNHLFKAVVTTTKSLIALLWVLADVAGVCVACISLLAALFIIILIIDDHPAPARRQPVEQPATQRALVGCVAYIEKYLENRRVGAKVEHWKAEALARLAR